MKRLGIHPEWKEDAKQLMQLLEQHWHPELQPDEIRRQLIELLLLIKRELARNSADARLVVRTYRRIIRHQAGREEQARANEAMKRIIGELSVVIIGILPFSFVTLPGLFALAHRFGIELLPGEPANNAEDLQP